MKTIDYVALGVLAVGVGVGGFLYFRPAPPLEARQNALAPPAQREVVVARPPPTPPAGSGGLKAPDVFNALGGVLSLAQQGLGVFNQVSGIFK